MVKKFHLTKLHHRWSMSEEWWLFQGLDLYIPHVKYQVKPQSSPWFSAPCAAAIVQRNHFVHLYQQNKSECKGKFRQASNCCKMVLLKLPNLHMLMKQKKSITSRKLGSQYFWRIANSVLNKNKSAIVPQFNDPLVFSSVSGKPKLFVGNFSMNSVTDDGGIYLPAFSSRTNILVAIVKNCQPVLSCRLAELFNMCLKESSIPNSWKVYSWSQYLRILGKDLPLKTTSIILGLFLWLVMSFSLRHLNTGLVSSRASLTLLGEGASSAVAGHSSSDGMTIKIPYGVDVFLHWQGSHPIFSHWVG